MKKHKLFKINDTYYMSNLEIIYEEDIIKLVEERDKYKKILDKIKKHIEENVDWDMDDFTKMDLAVDILKILEKII